MQEPAAIASPFRSRQEKAAEREAKREAVLLAAVRLFNRRGFHAASLDDVAASLGVSKPTIYHYLGNKEQVLIECVGRGLDALRAAIDVAGDEPGTGLDRLRRFMVCYAENVMDDFGRCVIRTGEECLSAEGAARFRARKKEIDRALRAMIEAAIADGSMQPADVKLTAFTLAGALNWTARWHSSTGEWTPGEIAENVVETLMRGLEPRFAAQARPSED